MQRPPFARLRPLSAVLLALVGAGLLIAAFGRAGAIPLAAHEDFGVLIRSQGGSMSHSATYPDTYRLIAAQSRMLQNAYLGLTGLALVTVGAIGAVGGGDRRGA